MAVLQYILESFYFAEVESDYKGVDDDDRLICIFPEDSSENETVLLKMSYAISNGILDAGEKAIESFL
eukprot:IDg16810t1